MSQVDQSNEESWVNVVTKKKSQKPNIVLSYQSQVKYREMQQHTVDPNHDSRFDPVVISKPKTPTVIAKHVAVKGGGKNQQSQQSVDMKKIERGEIKLAKSDRELSQKIQQARLAMKLSQDELNTKCGFPTHTIRNYENMSAIAKQNEIDVMRKVLGIQDLKKPKNIKVSTEDV